MSYIKPTSDIYLFYGVPLDADYRNTFYWDKDTQDQGDIFAFLNNNYRAVAVANNTYQRAHRNTFRIGITCDDLYDVNYMAFRNASFGDRWFFAFVMQVDYINNNTSEVTYQIDVIQTWWFDWDFCDCFVAREHSETDSISYADMNIEAEPIQTGEPVYNNYVKLDTDANGVSLNDAAVYCAFSPTGTGTKVDGTLYEGTYNIYQIYREFLGSNSEYASENGYAIDGNVLLNIQVTRWIKYLTKLAGGAAFEREFGNVDYMSYTYGAYSGLVVFSVPPENAAFISYFIDYMTDEGKFDNIKSIWMGPREIIDGEFLDYTGCGFYIHNTEFSEQDISSLQINPTALTLDLTSDTIDGYVPKNKKLWTYPYNYFIVDNGSGNALPLRYEYFPSLAPKFYISVNPMQPSSAMLQPKGYRMVNGENYTEFDAQNSEFLSLSGYPLCSWVGDYYAQWIARNGARETYNLVSGVASGLVDIAAATTITAGTAAGLASYSTGVSGLLGAGTAGTTALSAYTGNMGAYTGTEAINLGARSAAGWNTTSSTGYPSATMNANGGASKIFNSISNYCLNQYEASHTADYIRGTTNVGNIQFSNKRMGFYGGRISVNAKRAEIIDNYFTMFGYATNKVKKPNYSSRPYFNYVQTAGCDIKPRENDTIEYHNNSNADIPFMPASSRSPKGMSAADRLTIQSIFDNGITLWKTKTITDGYYIGDYSVDNSV